MRRFSRLLASSSLLLLGACDGRNALDSHAELVVNQSPAPPSAPAGGGPLASDAGNALQAPAEKQTTTASDAGTMQAEPPLPPATSCAELAAGGTSTTANIDGFVWQRQVSDAQGSAGLDYVSLGYSCGLKYQHENNPRVLEMKAADCAAAHGWATNARFLQILRTGDGCALPPDANSKNATESFEVYLPGGEPVQRKTWGCAEPTLDAERACFRALVDRLFP